MSQRSAAQRAPVLRHALACVVAAAFCANAYGAILTTRISARELTVGDRLQFVVSVVVPKGAEVVPPPNETFGKVVVKEWNAARAEREKSDSLTFDYLVTTYHVENCTIPSLHFVLKAEGTQDTLRTEPVVLRVVSVIDTDSADLKDIRPPLPAGKASTLWVYLLIAWAVVGVAAGVLAHRRLRKSRAPVAPPPKPPYGEALDALRALDAKNYLARGLVREYVFELSEILKRYISRRFSINVLDFTTEEVLAWLGVSGLSSELRRPIEWFFRTTDPVKFARFIPESDTMERLPREVRGFLDATRPEAPTTEQGLTGTDETGTTGAAQRTSETPQTTSAGGARP